MVSATNITEIEQTKSQVVEEKREKISWLQGLRGVACLLVVLTHARYFLLETSLWGMAEKWLRPGAAGVDLFFAISGFIMVLTTSSQKNQNFSRFLTHRFIRIWPPYAIVTILWVIFFAGGFKAFYQIDTLILIGKSLAFIPINTNAPLYFDVTLPLGWTLEFEAYFYIIFSISLLFKKFRLPALFGWVFISVIVIPYSKRGFDLDVTRNLMFSFEYLNLATNAIILEFLGGALIGIIYNSSFKIKNATYCWFIVIASITTAIYLCYGRVFDFHGPLKWGVPSFILLAGISISSKTINIQIPKFIVWLGSISYSLYLTHTTTQQLLLRFFIKNNINTSNFTFIILSTCVCIFVGYVFYEAIEVKFCGKLRQYLESKFSR